MTPYEEGFASVAAGRMNPAYTCETGRMNPTRERRGYWLGVRRGLRARMHLHNGADATMMGLAECDAARNAQTAGGRAVSPEDATYAMLCDYVEAPERIARCARREPSTLA